jgi:hypothetical protein
MTTSTNPEEIRAEIERTRASLSDNVDELAESAKPKNVAKRQVDKVKDAAGGVKDRVMGAASDTADTVAGKASSLAGQAGDAAGNVDLKGRTQGNPLAAGLIAFGAGLLISSLIPSSQKEQRAVSNLQDKAAPLQEKAKEAAQEVAGNLKEPVQEAAQSVKQTAAEGAERVKDEGSSAAEDVKGQVAESKDSVQQA